jgi:hypothetical protein
MIDKERLEAHLNNGEIEYIMCAANWIDDGIEHPFQPYNINTGLVFCGWRHPCIIQQYCDIYKPSTDPNCIRRSEIQGFLTTKNRFLTREESLVLVKENGQLKKPLIGGVLTSEDLW